MPLNDGLVEKLKNYEPFDDLVREYRRFQLVGELTGGNGSRLPGTHITICDEASGTVVLIHTTGKNANEAITYRVIGSANAPLVKELQDILYASPFLFVNPEPMNE